MLDHWDKEPRYHCRRCYKGFFLVGGKLIGHMSGDEYSFWCSKDEPHLIPELKETTQLIVADLVQLEKDLR